jgi:hypothetical protein
MHPFIIYVPAHTDTGTACLLYQRNSNDRSPKMIYRGTTEEVESLWREIAAMLDDRHGYSAFV